MRSSILGTSGARNIVLKIAYNTKVERTLPISRSYEPELRSGEKSSYERVATIS